MTNQTQQPSEPKWKIWIKRTLFVGGVIGLYAAARYQEEIFLLIKQNLQALLVTIAGGALIACIYLIVMEWQKTRALWMEILGKMFPNKKISETKYAQDTFDKAMGQFYTALGASMLVGIMIGIVVSLVLWVF